MERRRKDRKLAGALSVVVIAAAGGLIVNSSFSAGQYYRTVAETTDNPQALVGESFRIAGKVVPGTVVVQPTAQPDYTFRVNDPDGKMMTVHYAQAVPDTFQEGVEVVVEGTLVRPDLFEASHVIAKCPSKYEGTLTPEDVARKEAEARGQAVPTAPGKPAATGY